jgi:pimeloyl-ACP methyl ester carboxylesterase
MNAWSDDLVTHHRAPLGEVELHYVTAGEGPLVILLHGFPEFWYSWRHQIAALSAAGYRVVAPDMRGFNLSGKPRGVSAYAIDRLTGDVCQLMDHLGETTAAVVGHDWGGHVAWWLANDHPRRVRKLAIMNFPHPGHAFGVLRDPAQLRRSWYILFFQLPWLPERVVGARDFAALRDVFTTHTVHPGAFSTGDIERYVEAFRQPGALTASINYYRAMLRRSPLARLRQLRPLPMPVRMIWGAQDRHIELRLATPPPSYVPLCDVQIVEDASHWVQVDAPDRVNELLLEFLAR